MKQISIGVAMIGCLALLSCENGVEPPMTGGLDLRVWTIVGSPSAAAETASNEEAAAAAFALDSGRVIVTGPTSKTVSATPGQSVTIDSLTPGTYTVLLQGFENDEITYSGGTTDIEVTAGQNSSAPVLFAPTSLSFDALDQTSQLDVNAGGATVDWVSSAPGIASVDDGGLVTAVANGEAVITATSGTSAAEIAVSVAQEVDAVTVDPPTATIDPGATQQFTATPLDANSNPITGVNILWVSSDHNVATVDQDGLATGVGDGTATITAAARGEPGSAMLTVTPVAATATHLAITVQPASNTAGAAFTQAIEAEIQDANNNVVTTARNPVTLSISANPGGGTLSGTITVNAVNGIASFSGISIDKVGTGYTLMVGSSGLTADESTAFDIAAGPPASLEFSTQPANTEGNEPFSAAVRVTDAYGNQVASTASVSLELLPPASASKATLLGTTTVNAINGVATFSDLRLGVPATGYRLVARSGTFVKPESQTFDVFVTFVQIDAGRYHTCGVTVNGSAYCWGNNGNGQLGIGSFSQDSVPRLVSGSITFTQVSAGESHTCGVTAVGDAYCWGYNGQGRLGIGGQVNANVVEPTHVEPATPLVFAAIHAGGLHTCATTTVSGVPDAGYCWGYNFYGQIGNNSQTEVDIPTLVNGGFSFSQISAGTLHSCGIRASNDQMYCWGYNGEGAVGINNTTTPQLVPQLVSASLGWIGVAAGGPGSGGYYSCGLEQSNNNIYCWGHGNEGEMGDGAFADNLDETQISNQLTWGAVATGSHHVCMLDGNDAAYCVGLASNGQLGNGTTTPNTNVREAVMGGLSFTSITAGDRHTCALTAAGEVYCWGRNSEGQLGDGTRVQKTTPIQIVQ